MNYLRFSWFGNFLQDRAQDRKKIPRRLPKWRQVGQLQLQDGHLRAILGPTWRQLGSLGAVLAPPWLQDELQTCLSKLHFSNLFLRFFQTSRETPKNLPKWAPDALKCFKNGAQFIAKLNKKQTAINNKASTRASEQQSKPSQAKAKDKAKTEAKAQAQSQKPKPKASQANASQSNQLQFTCAFRFPPVQVW